MKIKNANNLHSIFFLAAMFLCGACEILIGIEDTSVPSDALFIRGTAHGVREPLSLRLEYDDQTELLSVTQDGQFFFPVELHSGDSYQVQLVGEPPCVLRGGTGVITETEPTLELICDGNLELTEIALSGPTAPDIQIEFNKTLYEAKVSLLQNHVSVIATPAYPEAIITVDGIALAKGVSSQPIPLNDDERTIGIEVANEDGDTRTYQVRVHRSIEPSQIAYAKASNTGGVDYFGTSVALSGDTLVVGAYAEDSIATGVDGDQGNNAASDSGAVYIFRRKEGGWMQEAYLKASNTGGSDNFGFSVALLGDLLAVGAFEEASAARGIGGNQGDDSARGSGAVYVFRRDGTTWTQEAYLKASNADADDHFGWSLALDADTLAVGAWGEASGASGVDGNQDDNSASESGAVYVFRRVGTVWTQEAYLKASNADAGDQFGESLALAGDTLAVGAWLEDSTTQGINGNQDDDSAEESGAVYIFRWSGSNWNQEAFIKASNTNRGDYFGHSLALSGDTLAIGADEESGGATSVNGNEFDNSAPESGAVYILRRIGTSWSQEAYIKASNTDAYDHFGSVALSGNTLAVGALMEDSPATGIEGIQGDNTSLDSGAVYIFRRTDTSWAQDAYLKASLNDTYDKFGSSLALSDDTLAVAAFGEDSGATGINGEQNDDSEDGSGAVYVFH